MPAAAMDGVERACLAGKCEESIDLLEQAVRLRPGDYSLHYRLGICYGGCCRSHPLVHPDMAIPYFRQALRFLGDEPGAARAAVLDQLGNTLIERSRTAEADSLRTAIDCHLSAAEIYRSLGMANEWARIQFNLGNSCCDLSEAAGEHHWAEAVSHYEQSLRIRTRQKDPQLYAAVQENLGTAYRRLPDFLKSIQCYRRALWVHNPTANPEKCAALQNNLGNAFLSLPDSGGNAARNARRALRHFDRALGLQSSQTESRQYGITQYNRALAHIRLARTSGAVTCLHQASRAFQACGEERFAALIRAQLARIETPNREDKNSSSPCSSPAAINSATPSR